MKKKTIASVLVVGALVGQSTIPMYAANIQTVAPYNEDTAIKKEEKETLTANVEGIDGYSDKFELPIGELNKDTIHAPQGYENYDFVLVKVGNTEITSIGTWKDSEGNEFWYYSTDGINATIFDEESLALLTVVFEKHVNTYEVKYDYDGGLVSVDGPNTVKEGEDLSFTINYDKSEYKITSIKISGKEKEYKDDLNKDTLTIPSTDIGENISIIITTTPISEYNVTYDNQYLMNGYLDEEAPGSVSKGGTYILKFRYEPGISVTYQLNQIRINGQELYLPEDVWDVGSESKPYDLGNGMMASVKVESKNIHWGTVYNDYHYVLTITNVNSDLHVEKINFKDDDRKEVINQNLDFFTDIDEWHAEMVELGDHQWKFSHITEEDNVIINHEGDKLQGKSYPQFIFVNLKEGYDGTTLKAYKNGSTTESERLITIDELKQRVEDNYYDKDGYNENVGYLIQKIEETGKEYTHCIKVDKGVDVRYAYSVEKAKYQVKYELDGGNWNYSDSNVYDYFDNSIIKIPYSIPSKEDYTFEGWQVGNKTYAPGQYVDITTDKDFYNALENGTFTFTAKWKKNDEVTEDTYWKYYVTLQQEQKNGYKVIGTKDFSVIKHPGKNPQILLKGVIDNILEENNSEIPNGFEAKYDNLKTLEKNEETITINIDAIDYKINYENIPGTSENLNPEYYSVLSGDEIRLKDPKDAENDNVVFEGWYSDRELTQLINAITIDENQLGEKTVYAKYSDDKNNNNVPDYKETKYKITYDANGGQNAPVDNNEYLSKEEVNLSTKYPTREKAVCIGWSKTQHKDVLNEKPNDVIGTYTFGEANATVYAVWVKDTDEDGTPDYEETKYTLTYDANGGQEAPTDSNKYVNKEEVKLSTKYPTREKAVCIGWSKTQHKDVLNEKPNDVIGTYTFGEANATVYAVWAADEDSNGIADYEQSANVTIEIYAGNNLVSRRSVQRKVGDTYTFNEVINNTISVDGKTYVFDSIENKSMVVSVFDDDNIIRLNYQLQVAPIDPTTPNDSDGSTTPTNPNGTGNNTRTDNDNAATNAGGTTIPNATTPAVGNDNEEETDNQQKTEEVEDNKTALAGEETEDDHKTPLSNGKSESSMALINLLLTLLSIFGAVACIVKKNDKVLKGISGVAAIASTVAFILTQTITTKIVMVDAWTVLFVIIALAQAGAYLLRKKEEEEKE